ncbi:MAG TPA: MHYT domain-containing protein [Candidatus Sulfotelmatobacter sp.]|nr:MHYT domain-containing protein [Candidatus Sulfotelmatobacter sp.]
MLLVTYDPLLAAASVIVAVMAAFTGLRLANGIRDLDPARRKLQIAKAAFVLGGGIWSMHFVAMLALRLPIAISYDALDTLGSVLIAILITGLGLSLMFVGERTTARTIMAGLLTGLGIVSMHYVGMSAISGNCLVSYDPDGFVWSTGIAVLFSICALRLAYGRRTLWQLSLGAVLLGVTIAGMHYSAMAFTRFAENAGGQPAAPAIQDGYLALIVAVAAFVVCGLFLLSALPVAVSRSAATVEAPVAASRQDAAVSADQATGDTGAVAGGEVVSPRKEAADAAPAAERLRLPYELHNKTYFIDVDRVQAIRAEGHYTKLYDGEEVHFCPWSISRIETHLSGHSFLRTHRSFLVNMQHARAFQRKKDKAYVVVPALRETMVPVSRFHLPEVRRALGV